MRARNDSLPRARTLWSHCHRKFLSTPLVSHISEEEQDAKLDHQAGAENIGRLRPIIGDRRPDYVVQPLGCPGGPLFLACRRIKQSGRESPAKSNREQERSHIELLHHDRWRRWRRWRRQAPWPSHCDGAQRGAQPHTTLCSQQQRHVPSGGAETLQQYLLDLCMHTTHRWLPGMSVWHRSGVNHAKTDPYRMPPTRPLSALAFTATKGGSYYRATR